MKLIIKIIIFAWALVTLWYGYTRMLMEPDIQTISVFFWLLVAIMLLSLRSNESFWMRLAFLVPLVIIGVISGLSFTAI